MEISLYSYGDIAIDVCFDKNFSDLEYADDVVQPSDDQFKLLDFRYRLKGGKGVPWMRFTH